MGYARLPLPSVDNSLMPELVWVPALLQPMGRIVEGEVPVPRWRLARSVGDSGSANFREISLSRQLSIYNGVYADECRRPGSVRALSPEGGIQNYRQMPRTLCVSGSRDCDRGPGTSGPPRCNTDGGNGTLASVHGPIAITLK